MSVIIDGTNGVTWPDGSASAPSIRGSNAFAGVYFPAANTIGITTSSTEQLRIDSSGNVGIGTSWPNTRVQVY